jgi:hypothetical protein
MATIKTQNGKVLTKDGKVSCECCSIQPSICDLNLNSSGGDEGYIQTFPVNTGNIGFDVSVTFVAYFQADRFLIQGIYDTGCIGGQAGQPSSVTSTVTIPPNTQNVTLQVIPNCLGGSGTIWDLSITCLLETPAP